MKEPQPSANPCAPSHPATHLPQQKATAPRRSRSGIGIFSLLFTGGLFGIAINAWRSKRREPLLTQANYERLEPGMSHDRVCEILGTRGQIAVSSATRTMLSWRNASGALLAAIFQNGSLVSFGGRNLN